MAGDVRAQRWIDRPRLVNAIATASVVLLEAPGGWGKTTLVDQHLWASGATVLTVRLADDTAASALVAALRRAARRAGLSDLAEVLGTHNADETLDVLIAALLEQPQPVSFVIDDAQFLRPDAESWLRSLADDLPAAHHMYIAGRQLPLVLTRRRPRRWAHLTTDDLRFNVDEVAAVLGVDDTGTAEKVHLHTAGWPAAVGLTAVTGRLDAPFDDEGALDRLVDDVLGDARDELAPLALLPLLSKAVADLVTPAGAFDRLVISGLPLRQVGRWHVLADPVREVLGRNAALPHHSASAVAAQYDLAAAISFLVGLRDLDALASMLAARHWSEFDELAAPELEAVLHRIGSRRRDAHPEILLAMARSADLRNNDLRAQWLSAGAQATDLTTAVGRGLETERARDAMRNADEAGALVSVESLLPLLVESDDMAARGRALQTYGMLQGYHSTPARLAQAEASFTEAAELFALVGEQRWQADALNRLAIMVSYHGGRIARAAEQETASLALLAAGSRDWAVGMTYYADILDALGRSAESEAAAREAWEAGRRLGDERIVAYGAWSLAITCAHSGDPDGTRRWLDEVERNPGNWLTDVSGQEFLAFGADLLGGLGDVDGAMAYRERCAARVGHGGTQELLDVLDGRLEAMYGDPARAIELFERLDGEPYATIRTKWVRLLFRAICAKRSGDRVGATKFVERALEIVAQMELPDLPQRHEPVVVQMLSDVWPGGAAQSGTGQLRVVLLGGFTVLRGMEVVTPAPGNPATLVKVLALRDQLTTEQAIDLLWPDADLSVGRARLRNLLNRIRGQAGDLVIREGESLRLATDVATDIGSFEDQVGIALAAAPTDRAGLARLALGAYSGELLPADVYEDWAAGARERLRRRYLSLVDIVAADAIERGDLDEAMRLLDLAIEQEPLEERRYVVAATALIGLGRRASAREVLRRAEAALAELGVRVGAELQAVGRSLDATSAR